MSTKTIREAYHSSGYQNIENTLAKEFAEAFYLSVLAFREGQFEAALAFVEKALEWSRDSLLARESQNFLKHVARFGKQSVYSTARGFSHFINGGGNLELYQNLRALLQNFYRQHGDIGLLDIGTGDVRALLPALSPKFVRLDLVKPSEKMRGDLSLALQQKGRDYYAHPEPLQAFIIKSEERWDIIQATYSVHSIKPIERIPMLQWIHHHENTFLLAEFDVPDFQDSADPESFQYVIERYEKGLHEYQGAERDTVAQEFLIPMMFSNFDQDQDRIAFEQPLTKWLDDLRSVEFTIIRQELIAQYWWADSFLIVCKS